VEDWHLSALDRGYFPGCNQRDVVLPSTSIGSGWQSSQSDDQTTKVLVAHSFGLHCIAQEVIADADLLVILSGFEAFHTSEKALSRRAIRRMLLRLKDDHRSVLREFYSACFGDSPWPSSLLDTQEACDLALLAHDLRRLDAERISLENLSRAKSILILHGAKDIVTPVELAANLHKQLPDSRLVIHPDAGHALPFTHPNWCLQQLGAAMENSMMVLQKVLV
jgi:pimeloyl-ACP methyl ester carboxylesterase